MTSFGLFGFSCLGLVLTATAVPFSYDRNHTEEGPHAWGILDENCNGRRQSPINIDTRIVVYGRPIVIQYMFRNSKLKGKFRNNGHSPSFKVEDDSSYLLSGVPYHERDIYELYEWHMHFGSGDDHGSEHTIDGQYYAGEIHMVHFNTKYRTYKNALQHPDGRVVVGVFVQAGEKSDRPHVDLFLQRHLPRIQKHGLRSLSPRTRAYMKQNGIAGKVIPAEIAPVRFLPDSSDIYTYSGSATTPRCEENVQWILHRQPIVLSAKTLKLARRLEDSKGIEQGKFGNFRPTQRWNGRLLEANFVRRRILRLSPFAFL